MNRHVRQLSIALPLLLATVAVTAGDSMEEKEDMLKEGMAKEEAKGTAMPAAPMMEKSETDSAGMKMEDGNEMDGMKKKDM